jgi:hypothetical protein
MSMAAADASGMNRFRHPLIDAVRYPAATWDFSMMKRPNPDYVRFVEL